LGSRETKGPVTKGSKRPPHQGRNRQKTQLQSGKIRKMGSPLVTILKGLTAKREKGRHGKNKAEVRLLLQKGHTKRHKLGLK